MTVMDHLKDGTASLHRAAESHPFQQALARGTLDRQLYIQYLCQLWLVHMKLEAELRRHESVAGLKSVLTAGQYQEVFLRKDLDFFGVDMEAVTELAATSALRKRIEAASERSPITLLGFHYVLWGSKHGGRFLAQSIARSYGLDGKSGCSYFDPYGAEFHRHWRIFAQAMNAACFSEEEKSCMLKSAVDMFSAVQSIEDELLTRGKA